MNLRVVNAFEDAGRGEWLLQGPAILPHAIALAERDAAQSIEQVLNHDVLRRGNEFTQDRAKVISLCITCERRKHRFFQPPAHDAAAHEPRIEAELPILRDSNENAGQTAVAVTVRDSHRLRVAAIGEQREPQHRYGAAW